MKCPICTLEMEYDKETKQDICPEHGAQDNDWEPSDTDDESFDDENEPYLEI